MSSVGYPLNKSYVKISNYDLKEELDLGFVGSRNSCNRAFFATLEKSAGIQSLIR